MQVRAHRLRKRIGKLKDRPTSLNCSIFKITSDLSPVHSHTLSRGVEHGGVRCTASPARLSSTKLSVCSPVMKMDRLIESFKSFNPKLQNEPLSNEPLPNEPLPNDQTTMYIPPHRRICPAEAVGKAKALPNRFSRALRSPNHFAGRLSREKTASLVGDGLNGLPQGVEPVFDAKGALSTEQSMGLALEPPSTICNIKMGACTHQYVTTRPTLEHSNLYPNQGVECVGQHHVEPKSSFSSSAPRGIESAPSQIPNIRTNQSVLSTSAQQGRTVHFDDDPEPPDSPRDIFGVRKLSVKDGAELYELNGDPGPIAEEHIVILSKPLKFLNHQIEVRIWNSDMLMSVVLDSGASISICSEDVARKVDEFRGKVRECVTAHAFDGTATGIKHSSNKSYFVPVERASFDIASGDSYPVKELLKLWEMDCLPPRTILLGRDSMSTLRIGLVSEAAVKQALYQMRASKFANEVPANSETANWLEGNHYENRGDLGFYVINSDRSTEKLATKWALKSEVDTARKGKDSVRTVQIYGMLNDQTLNPCYSISHHLLEPVEAQSADFVVIGPKDKAAILLVDDSNIRSKDEQGLHLSKSVNLVSMKWTESRNSKGEVIGYPEV